MSLGFLSPARVRATDTLASPLARALDGADPEAVRDLSLDGQSSSSAATSPRSSRARARSSSGSRRDAAFLFTDDDPARRRGDARVRAASARTT